MIKTYCDNNDIFNIENGMHMVSGEPGKYNAEDNLIARGYFVIIYTGEPFEV